MVRSHAEPVAEIRKNNGRGQCEVVRVLHEPGLSPGTPPPLLELGIDRLHLAGKRDHLDRRQVGGRAPIAEPVPEHSRLLNWAEPRTPPTAVVCGPVVDTDVTSPREPQACNKEVGQPRL
jgi:hypothetical protein